MSEITVPVLIVGRGRRRTRPCRCRCRRTDGTPLLVSREPGMSDLPKAYVLHEKTMEIYVSSASTRRPTSGPHRGEHARDRLDAVFAGTHEGYGREIGREGRGAPAIPTPTAHAQPLPTDQSPQIRLEPILKAHAEALGPQRIRFNHSFVSLVQDDAGVTALIEDRGTRRQYTVRARYLLGCDGGRAVGKQIGVTMDGIPALAMVASIYMSADLSPWARIPRS